MFPKSIRWQIQAFHGVLLFVLVTGLIAGFYSYERRARYHQLDAQLLEMVTPLLPRVLPPRGGGRLDGPRERRPPPRHEMEEDFRPPPRPMDRPEQGDDPVMVPYDAGKFYFISWSPEGNINRQSANAPSGLPLPEREEFVEGQPAIRSRGDSREVIHFLPNGATVLIGTSAAGIQQHLIRLGLGLAGAGVLVVGLGLAGGWWLAGRAIRPIASISSAAEAIAGGQLSKRINVAETESELGALAGVLNRTFEKLEQSFEQQIRFTADASHELRTPISVILTQIQLALSRDRSSADYQRTLRTCERAAERMRGLVNSLLELARVDSGEFKLVTEACDLSRIGREALEFVQPLAEARKVTLRAELDSVPATVDAMKLGQVLINLLTNAIQHNGEGITVSLSLQRNGELAAFRVADNGAGIPPEALPHLFERFFRVDKARSQAKGNSGLGLAISKAIVEAHGGSIWATSEIGQGTEFVVELPVPRAQAVPALAQAG